MSSDAARLLRFDDQARPDVAISCVGIERSFGGLRALKGVDFEVRRGEIGLNGSGKTTMVNTNPDIQEAYLADHKQVDHHAVKHYRRRKRWLA